MVRRKKLLVVFFLVVLVFGGVFFFKNKKEIYINMVLSRDTYSYLPIEAKEYVKNVYKRDGNLILTERNKKKNMQYLNPDFVEYLTYSTSKKEEVSVIPNELIIDYVSEEKKEKVGTSHDESYNLIDYTTPMKNQKNLGLCWAFATIENAETYLMNMKGEVYQEGVSEVFSPRQLDYLTAISGIKDYSNKYGNHVLGEGSNFYFAEKALVDGLSFVSESWKYNSSYTLDKLEMSDVFNDTLSKYELDSTLEMPYLDPKSLNLSNQTDLDKYNNYISRVKDLIILYGGPYISSQAPGYSCSAINYYDNKKHIIDVDSTCTRDGNHAMQIVGWDDNYSYKYCVSGKKHTVWTSNCSASNTVEGKGAWLVRNSWGAGDSDEYTYLAYKSTKTEYDFITSLDKAENRKWNYTYNKNNSNLQFTKKSNSGAYNYVLSINPKFNIDSELVKIKYRNTLQNINYKIYYSISGNDNDYQLINEKMIEYPGYVTVDLSESNYKITKNSKIKIVTNNASLNYDDFSIFTVEKSDNKYILTSNKIYQQNVDNYENGYYSVHLYSDTYNIPSGSEVSYQLFSEGGNDVTDSMIVTNNVVSSNMINANLFLPDIKDKAYFTVNILYDGKVISSSLITVSNPHPALGKGTIDEPYVIMTPQDLDSINYNMDAHFVLGTDIDLTYDTQNKKGKYYNSGIGWIPIGYMKKEAFTGSIDGYYNGIYHKIIGLKSSALGFIYYIDSGDKTVDFKNIIFEKAVVEDFNLVAGAIVGRDGGKVNIQNIAAVDSTLSGFSSIIAQEIYACGKDSVIINGVFSNSIFNEDAEDVMSTLAWKVATIETTNKDASAKISNIQILGRINNETSGYYTALFRFGSGNLDISNVIFNNNSKTPTTLFAKLNKSDSGKMPNLENIYYLGDSSINYFSDSFYTNNNVLQKDILDLVNSDSYNDWDNFNDNWSIKTVDSIVRIPILKFVSFNYTYNDDIEVNLLETVNIYDYIYPNGGNYQNLTFENLSEDKISLDSDGNIKGLSCGTASVRVISNYDGFDKNITIYVLNGNRVEVKFNSNNLDNIVTNQIFDKNINTLLDKNTFTKDGYVFVGWNTKKDGSGINYNDEQEVKLDNNLELFAQWVPINYKVEFNSDGEIKEQSFVYDEKKKLDSNTFTKEGYIFKEWNTMEDGSGTSYNDKQEVINLTNIDGAVIKLYAQWKNNSIVITYNSNDDSNQISEQDISINTNTKLNKNTFTRVGYIFNGWNTKKDGSGTSYTDQQTINFSDDVTLYVQWIPISYILITHSNNGTDEFREQVLVYDREEKINKNTFTKEGYVFVGWNTNKDGSGTSYTDQQSVINLSTEMNTNIDLYAQWEEESGYVIDDYVVDYDNSFIDKINSGTTLEKFKDNIKVGLEYSVDVDYKTIDNNKVLYTGGKTKISKDGVVLKEFTNIIIGDVNGNGKIDIIDYIRIMKDIMNTEKLLGVYALSADVNNNNKIDIIDYIRIMKIIMEES